MSSNSKEFTEKLQKLKPPKYKQDKFATKQKETQEILNLSDTDLTQVIYIALQHGQTDWNIKNITKDNAMPLNNKGIENTQKKAKELKSVLWYKNIEDIQSTLLVTFPHFIKRDIQTARTYCNELGLEFPENETLKEIRKTDHEHFLFKSIFEILIYKDNPKFQLPQIEEKLILEWWPEKTRTSKFQLLELIEPLLKQHQKESIFKKWEKSNIQELIFNNSELFDKQKVIDQMNKSNLKMINSHSNLQTRFPYLRCESWLATRKKWLKGSWEKFPTYTDRLNNSGTEWWMASTIRSAKYYKQQINETLSALNNWEKKVIVSIWHRTWNTAFKKLIEGSDTYNPKEHGNRNTSSTVVGYLNKNTYKSKEKDQQGKFLNSPWSTLFTFDIASYHQQLEKINSLVPSINFSDNIFDNQNKINAYLQDIKDRPATIYELLNKSPHPLVRTLIKHLLNNKSNNEKVFSFLERKFQSLRKEEKKKIIKDLYINDNSKVCKYALHLILDNKELLMQIEKELEDPSQFKTYINELKDNKGILDQKTRTIMGEINLKEIYTPPTVIWEEETYKNEKEFLKSILKSDKIIHTIQGTSWSWKSLLLESIKKHVHDLTFLKEINARDVSPLKIDKNIIHEKFSLDKYLENFDSSNILLCIDGLDEIDAWITKKLYNTITSERFTDKYPDCKIIVSSRYFDEKWENDNINNYQLESLETKNKVNQMINKYSQTLSLKKSETFKKVIHKLIHNLWNTITPIHIAMISWLMDNREFVKNIFKEKIELSDLYKYFVETIINHQEDKITSEKELEHYEENPFNSIEYEDLKLDFISYLTVYCDKEAWRYPKSYIQILLWEYVQENNLYEKLLWKEINWVEKFILSIIKIDHESIKIENLKSDTLRDLKQSFSNKNKLNKETELKILSLDMEDIITHEIAYKIWKKHDQLLESFFSLGLFSKYKDYIFWSPENDFFTSKYPENPSEKEKENIKDLSQWFDFMHKSLNRYFWYKFYKSISFNERIEIVEELSDHSQLKNQNTIGVKKDLSKDNSKDSLLDFIATNDKLPNATSTSKNERVDTLSFPLFNNTSKFIELFEEYNNVGLLEKVPTWAIDELVKEHFSSKSAIINKEFLNFFKKDSQDYITIYNIVTEWISKYMDEFYLVWAPENLNPWMDKFYSATQAKNDDEIIELLTAHEPVELGIVVSHGYFSPEHILRQFIKEKFGV